MFPRSGSRSVVVRFDRITAPISSVVALVAYRAPAVTAGARRPNEGRSHQMDQFTGPVRIATSLRKSDVEAARVFPQRERSPLRLSADRVGLLQFFSGRGQLRPEPPLGWRAPSGSPLALPVRPAAAVRAELSVLYHQEITRLLAERGLAEQAEAQVVMTVGTAKDEPPDWRERYELTRQVEAKVQARFNDHRDPLRFLIVTAKLLTGFDAPIEGVLYLDKPLRMHTLFQAITRTNRRWRDPETGQEKHYGLVVDYVGLGNEIARALRKADPERGGKRPVDVEGLIEELAAAMEATLARFAGVDRADRSFESLMAAQQRIPPGEVRDDFARDFLQVQMLWEFLYPDLALDRFRHDYRWLAQVYESVKPRGTSDALLWHRLGRKTLELVHGHITDLKVTGTGLDAVIVDPETIDAIHQLTLNGPGGDDGDGVITVGEALDTIEARLRRRLEASRNHPVWVQLSERLERLRRHQLDQAQASVEFLREMLEVARQVAAAEKAENDGRLNDLSLLPDPNIGALTQILREYAPPNTPVIIEEVVREIDAIVKQVRFTGWTTSQPGDRTVRKELKLALRNVGLPTSGELFDRAYAYIRENY